MDYRDYRTNEVISRDQYIKNGLERGTLVIQENCGCVVIQDRTADAYIVFCPKHEAGPDLYEACKQANYLLTLEFYDLDNFQKATLKTLMDKVFEQTKQAIALAEGKGD